MALPRNALNILYTGYGKSAPRFEQVLHDHGLFLDWDHDISHICRHFHNREIDPGRDDGWQI